jgi:iron(III) transport system permease protein
MAYLPFALPPLVGVLSFWYLIGRDGFLPRYFRDLGVPDGFFLSGPSAILLIHTYSFYVFFYAMVSSALENMDVSQIEAARTLGASRCRVLTRVTLPVLRPALLGAALLTFMSSGASFSAPLIFGKEYPMLSVRIFQERTQFNHAEAYTLTVVLAAVSLLGVLLFRARKRAPGSAVKGVPVPLRSRGGRALAAALSVACVVLLLTPHLTILGLSFVDHSAWFEEIVPTTYTMDNYLRIARNPQDFRPLVNSLWMSAAAAIATLAVGVPAAYLIARKRPASRWVNLLVMIPWALPGTVIAVNLIVAFNDPWLPLYGTVWILPLAYFVRNVPLLTRIAAAAIEPFDATLIEAGQTLGASRRTCFRRIVLPLLAPAVGAGAALVFATCLGEFVASALLYLPANIPISQAIYQQWKGSGIGSAYAYSVFLMGLLAATFVLSRRFASRLL